MFDPVLYEDLEAEFKKADQEEAFNTIMKEASDAVDIAWSLRDINSIRSYLNIKMNVFWWEVLKDAGEDYMWHAVRRNLGKVIAKTDKAFWNELNDEVKAIKSYVAS